MQRVKRYRELNKNISRNNIVPNNLLNQINCLNSLSINNEKIKLNKKEYLQQFDSKKNGDLHEQEWVESEIEQYHKKIMSLKQYYCPICSEMWPTIHNLCFTCKKYKKTFTSENNMRPNLDEIPLEIKRHFEELSMVTLFYNNTIFII